MDDNGEVTLFLLLLSIVFALGSVVGYHYGIDYGRSLGGAEVCEIVCGSGEITFT